MMIPAGTYAYEVRVTGADGQWQTITWSIARDIPCDGSFATRRSFGDTPGDPETLLVGEYDADLTVTLPDGAKVSFPYERRFSIRARELILSLQADKAAYLPGDLIVLTGSVRNAWGKPLTFDKVKPPTIALVSVNTGHDTMSIDPACLPDRIEPDATHKLFELRFVAGQADKRFQMGARFEMFPLPFGARGKYTIRLSLEGVVFGPPVSENAKPVGFPVVALPAETEFEIIRENKASADDAPAPEYEAVITQNARGAASITASHAGRTTVLDIIDPGGIGRAEVTLAKGDWPERLVVRLHHSQTHRFRDVEGFTIGSERVTLQGSLRTRDTEVVTKDSRSVAEAGKGLTFMTHGGYQEIVIPAARHFKDARTLKLQWVDQYR